MLGVREQSWLLGKKSGKTQQSTDKVLQGMGETSIGRKFGHTRPVLGERGGEGMGPL